MLLKTVERRHSTFFFATQREKKQINEANKFKQKNSSGNSPVSHNTQHVRVHLN